MHRKIRILIAIDCTGRWHAFGSNWGEGDTPDDMLRNDAYDRFEGEVARFVWVEAEIPPPRPEQEVEGVVSDG